MKTYRIIEEELLHVDERSKLFLEFTEYKWDVFVKVYKEKFVEFNPEDMPIIEKIIDAGGAIYDDDILLDFNSVYINN